ncbi:MAG: tetratricopeptide repeat protein [Oculatellaceae cyanobacterium bins.114]|nr:tetratricopeptide repeat protein [Oculatellaceae cyanobacterium bins.114]
MMQLFVQPPDLTITQLSSSELISDLSHKVFKELFEVLLEVAKQDFLTWIENIKRVREGTKQGKALFDLEEYQEATEIFREVIIIEPKHYEAWFMRSLCLLLLGELQQSIRSFDQTINRKETYQAHHYKAIAQILIQDFDSALESLEKAIQLNPDISELWFNKARILEKLNKYAEAIDAYDQAVTIKPANHQAVIYGDILKNPLQGCFEETTEILIGKASVMIEKLRYEEATAYINRVIEINAENAEAWSLRGDVLRWNFDHQDAIYSYQRAIEINIELSQSHYGMGMSFYHLKRYGLAYKALKEAVNLANDFSDAFFNLGMASYQLKYWDKANEAFTRFCELNPSDVKGFLYRGHTYRKRRDYSNALSAYQEVLSRDSKNLQALTCIGNIYVTLGNEYQALEVYSEVVDLNPNDQSAQSKVWDLKRSLELRRLEHERQLEYQREREKQEIERQERERLEMKNRQQQLEERRREKELREMFEYRARQKRKWFGLF